MCAVSEAAAGDPVSDLGDKRRGRAENTFEGTEAADEVSVDESGNRI